MTPTTTSTAPVAPVRPARSVGGYDAVIVVSFGGPEGPDDVIPFLQNVTEGRGVPPERLAEVGAHYDLFGGRSPLNDQNRALIAALRDELDTHGIDLPIYWGNRNWHPLLPDTVARMAADGVVRALAFVTSAFSSYPSCRQYLDDLVAATAAPGSPRIDKLRVFGNHPGFVEAVTDRLLAALGAPTPGDAPAAGPRVDRRRAGDGATRLVFTAHSIPAAMGETCDYVIQLRDTSAEVAARAGFADWDLVFQSRSGPPAVPWLGPDINDHLRTVAADGVDRLVAVPLGFVSDHMEVVYDLDTEAAATAAGLGVSWVRVPTVGTHPRFVTMVRELIAERLDPAAVRPSVGELGLRPDPCLPGCCPAPGRPPTRPR